MSARDELLEAAEWCDAAADYHYNACDYAGLARAAQVVADTARALAEREGE